MNANHIDAVIQIRAEFSGLHFRLQVARRSRHDADVDLPRLRISDPAYLTRLQGPKQLHLQGLRQFADFVEEQGPLVGLLEQTGSI